MLVISATINCSRKDRVPFEDLWPQKKSTCNFFLNSTKAKFEGTKMSTLLCDLSLRHCRSSFAVFSAIKPTAVCRKSTFQRLIQKTMLKRPNGRRSFWWMQPRLQSPDSASTALLSNIECVLFPNCTKFDKITPLGTLFSRYVKTLKYTNRNLTLKLDNNVFVASLQAGLEL